MQEDVKPLYIQSDNDCVKPDESNIHEKQQFRFLIDAFLKFASQKPGCSFDINQYEELMDLWEEW